jgi:hypothetical protein
MRTVPWRWTVLAVILLAFSAGTAGGHPLLLRLSIAEGAVGTPPFTFGFTHPEHFTSGFQAGDYQLGVVSVALGTDLGDLQLAAGPKLVETWSSERGPGGFGCYLPVYLYARTNPAFAGGRHGPFLNARAGVFPWGGAAEGGYVTAAVGASWEFWVLSPGLELNWRHQFSERIWRDYLSLHVRLELGRWIRLGRPTDE